ncbi:MAG TPA: alpha/beta hydrolase, partial [Vicinamibacteria bacterium]
MKQLVAGLSGLGLVAAAVSGAPGAERSAAPSGSPIKNIVLVHGAFADGSSWAKVIPILQARGYHV